MSALRLFVCFIDEARFRPPFFLSKQSMLAAKACEPHPGFVAFAMRFPRATNPRCSEATKLVGSLTAIAQERLPAILAATTDRKDRHNIRMV